MIKYNSMGIISSKKRGGEPLWKGGGGTDPLFPPLNPPLTMVGPDPTQIRPRDKTYDCEYARGHIRIK